MNKEISKVLRERLRSGEGLPFVDKYVGMVQTVTEEVATDETHTRKRFPVATEIVLNDVCSAHEEIITPDSSLKGLVYFEDNGTTPNGKIGKGYQYTSNLTLICWINRAKVVSEVYSEITGIAIQNIIQKLQIDENPENVSMFIGLTVTLNKIFPQDANLFSKYTFDEAVTQYLRPPFEFFGLSLQVKYRINPECVEPLTITSEEVCY